MSTQTNLAPPLSNPERDALEQLGIDPLDIPDLSEPQVFELAQRVNPHTTRWLVRHAIAAGELRGICRGKKYLHSRRELARWLQTSTVAGGQR